jgi:hypothetical protein
LEPQAQWNQVPITAEQVASLRTGEDPMNVLPSNILPAAPVMPPLPPAQTPESVGELTMTQENQLNEPPWSSMELSTTQIPDFMSHVITDERAMELLQNLIPNAGWQSDIMRPGASGPPLTMPEPAPVPVYDDSYIYGGPPPVADFPWSS